MEKFVLKTLRDAIGKKRGGLFTQDDMGDLTGVTGQQYRKYEKGQDAPLEALVIYRREAMAIKRKDLVALIDNEIRARKGGDPEPVMSPDEAIFVVLDEIRKLSGKIDRVLNDNGGKPGPRLV